MIRANIRIGFLGSHPGARPLIAQWLETEWPNWYGAGGQGDAHKDLLAYSQIGAIPTGLVAYLDDQPCGFMTLKSEPLSGYENRTPWVGAGFVLPHLRGRGIGGKLLAALEVEAEEQGHGCIYSGTTSAKTLLQRSGWRELGVSWHDGEKLYVYEKAL